MPKDLTWPAWFSSPKGDQKAVFEKPEDVPAGWTSGAEAQTVDGAKPAKTAPAPKSTSKPADKADAKGDELDAHGHPYDPSLHAATKSKTKDGLWRMKVGVKRPDPKPGYPLDL